MNNIVNDMIRYEYLYILIKTTVMCRIGKSNEFIGIAFDCAENRWEFDSDTDGDTDCKRRMKSVPGGGPKVCHPGGKIKQAKVAVSTGNWISLRGVGCRRRGGHARRA